MGEWKLQDAKNQFSAVVDAAIAGEPQHVTRRGKPAVGCVGIRPLQAHVPDGGRKCSQLRRDCFRSFS